MDPRQSVVLATMLSVGLFFLAGDEATRKTRNGIARLQGKKPSDPSRSESGPKFTVQRAAGWAAVFLLFIILADVPATSELGSAFAWLLFVSMFLAFGADAFANVNQILEAK